MVTAHAYSIRQWWTGTGTRQGIFHSRLPTAGKIGWQWEFVRDQLFRRIHMDLIMRMTGMGIT